jgi:uncharacterized protein YfaT (DUF1175 family)
MLAEIAPGDGCPLAHLLLIGGTYAQAEAWRNDGIAGAYVVAKSLPELRQCNPIHLTKWFDNALPGDVALRHKRDVSRLRVVLEEEFPGAFYYRDLKLRVTRFLRDEANAR